MSDRITTKSKYKVIKSGNIDYSDNTKVLQPKIDGSHSIFELNSNKPNDIYSYRVSKKTGETIDHSNQVPRLRDLEIPNQFNKTILRGELYATAHGKPLPAESIGGILNSGVEKSLKMQREEGWLRPVIYDIIKYKGRNVEKEPYRQKLDMIQDVQAAVPELQVAETAFTPEQKRRLVEKIKSGKHPDTREGIVQWDLLKPTGTPAKLKFRDNFDVIIRKIFPAIDKSGKEKNEAGGFGYSWTPKGKIVGNVGTGFNRETKVDMLKNPEDYVGMVARVKSSQKYNSEALRAPAYYTMDIEKNLNQIKQAAFIYEFNKIALDKSMPTKLILARHGETDLNADGDKIRGWKNIPLDDKGKQEAQKMAKKLLKEKVDVVLSSDLNRAVNTAKVFAEKAKLPVIKTTNLRPWDLGKLSGKHSKDVLGIVAEYTVNKPNKLVDGGESFNTFKNRYLNYIKDIKKKYPDKTVAIFTHHRNDRLMSAWEKKGMPDNKNVDLNLFLQKGIEPGRYRVIDLKK